MRLGHLKLVGGTSGMSNSGNLQAAVSAITARQITAASSQCVADLDRCLQTCTNANLRAQDRLGPQIKANAARCHREIEAQQTLATSSVEGLQSFATQSSSFAGTTGAEPTCSGETCDEVIDRQPSMAAEHSRLVQKAATFTLVCRDENQRAIEEGWAVKGNENYVIKLMKANNPRCHSVDTLLNVYQ